MQQLKDRYWQSRSERDPNICCLRESPFKYNDQSKLKVKGWKRYAMQTLIKKCRSDYINIR